MSDSLKDAYTSFTRKKYSDVIRILESQVFRFRDNYNFFYLLGMSCLHQGDFGGAFSYLRRAVDLRENDVNVLLGLAAVYLKRGDTGNALKIWLDIIEIEPGNPQAQRGLNFLKKINDPDDLLSFSADDKISKFLPVDKSKAKLSPAAVFLPVMIAAAAAVFIIPVTREAILSILPDKAARRPEVTEISLDERKDYLSLEGEYSYILTEKEIERKFRDIQDYLYAYRDNMAQKEINMLLLSNASEYVKDRARLLEKYVQPPEITEFKDSFDYSDVASEPLLYRNCYVLWKGKTTNVEATPESILFDFLVGYHEEKTLDGIVPVAFNFNIKIIPNQSIELLGRILLTDSGGITLQGVSIRRLQ